ncbi:MAG: DUF4863 domain-containing protein [Rhodobacteraceae bacterium]|nr:MAG: DUF4863 domain-containing protein [Paracoccaceae bacterium]
MSETQFTELMETIATQLSGKPLDAALEDFLNKKYGVDSVEFQQLSQLCIEGEAEGWLMSREAGGVKYGRAVKPDTTAKEFSIDVVRMKDVKGPHHIHTTGEIGAIMPLEGTPLFDGRGAGWYVYKPGSDHHPTVSGGDAHVLYLLPNGSIEFTGK